MKKILLFSVALIIGLAVTAQNFQLKNSVPTAKKVTEQAVGIEPASTSNATVTPGPVMVNGDGVDVVSVITIGTSANAYGNGYAGGQKTLVWADPLLGVVQNFHRLGPGATPPSFSGYLGFDLGINKGMTSTDWTVNNQVYNAVENAGGTYFVDAARYPQAVIYNPGTGIDDAVCAFFAPNLSNTLSTWGGLSYGTAKLTNTADSTKHLYWYAPPPYTYIPDGMMLLGDGKIIVTDLDQNWESGAVEYQGNIILTTGVWNATDMDFEYTMSLLEHPTLDNQRPANERIAASPNGMHVWVVSLANTGDLPPVGGVQERFYPILWHSADYGVTWSDPIPVQLDGTDGIDPIKNFLSDYRIEQLYTPPFPTRDEIPYTTAFDCDIVVDAWGNPHIGVVVGVSADGYSIATGDSSYAVFDVYSPDKGDTWCAALMGHPWTFRGDYGDLTEDNRVNASVNYAGDKVFFTWIDTQVPGITDNINPDVFARGFDLVLNALTSVNGDDQPNNVTFLSDVTQQAYFSTASYYTFSVGEFDYIPIVSELLSDPNDPAAPVTFKYIPDFAYQDGDFTIMRPDCSVPFPVGVDNRKAELEISIYPNPVTDIAVMKVNMIQGGNVQISLTNMLGQTVMNLNKGFVAAGNQQFTLDARNLNAGVYFATVQINGEKYTRKVVVE
ncbi:MAG: T9SS type A sorting domain-containing protein [Bacteroidales bacterium]|nr:T9SS type A sorting domain-containing protein [Bacteroidales bacterium]